MTNDNNTPIDTTDVTTTPLNVAATDATVTTIGNITTSTAAATTSTILPAGNAADETTRRSLFGAGLYQTSSVSAIASGPTCPVSPGPIVLPLHKLFPYSTEEKMRVSISVNDPDHEEIMCLYFNYDTSSTGVVFA
ncbi:hypothetical protein F2Q69_00049670 [Brassica cretica]|uniref:Uncharacterized protein n=1 Tax=Brassica cretica TaxID=69181 RepID=A0A8S9PTS7_BRACR|nr:hypothetical protein F2Q69_00049670 [Brassica cretica]